MDTELTHDTSFAVICSFFNKFGAMLGLTPLPFTKIEQMLTKIDQSGRVDRDLIDLHVKLLRRVQLRSATHERWESALLKFCSLIPVLETECLQLARFGYLLTPLSTKLTILKVLCESQFDYNPRFKENIFGSLTSVELRLLPVGNDKDGLAYWYQQDADLSIRIYTEEPDDQSGGTWELLAKSREELTELITKLRDYFAKIEDESKEDNVEVKIGPKKLVKINENGVENEQKSPENENEIEDSPESLIRATGKMGTFLDTFQDESCRKSKNPLKATENEMQKVKDENEFEICNEPQIEISRRSARCAAIKESHEKSFLNYDVKSRSIEKNEAQEVEEEEWEEEYEDGESESETSDSDFMPLSELRKAKSKRKTRFTRPKIPAYRSDEESDSNEEQIVKTEERKKAAKETPCRKCGQSGDWALLLLCDRCDDAWHTWCLRPSLHYVPDDDWFCPECQHSALTDKLALALEALDEAVSRKAVEDRRRQTATDRMRREMEYIGVSLKNIIPTHDDNRSENSDSEDENENGERERKQKKTKVQIPIALSRSKRTIAKVDYNFEAFDELIQEAVDEISDSSSRTKYRDPARPPGGAGRGKDMANILEAHQRQGSRNDTNACISAIGTDEPAKLVRTQHHTRKLTDLDVDELTESDTDEYQVSELEASSEPSDEDYVPSDDEPKRRSNRLRARTRSDDEFVVSDSDSDYRPVKRSRKTRKTCDDDESEDSLVLKSRKASKWVPKGSTSGSDYSDDSRKKTKQTSGSARKIRRTRSLVNYSTLDGTGTSDEEEEVEGERRQRRPVGALNRPKRQHISSDEAETDFKPEDEAGNDDFDADDDSSDGSNNNLDEEMQRKEENANSDTDEEIKEDNGEKVDDNEVVLKVINVEGTSDKLRNEQENGRKDGDSEGKGQDVFKSELLDDDKLASRVQNQLQVEVEEAENKPRIESVKSPQNAHDFQEKDKNPLQIEPTFQEKLKNPLQVEPTFQEKDKNPLQVEPTFQEKLKNPLQVEPTFQEKDKNPLQVEPTFQEKLKNPLQVEPTFQEKDKNPLQVEPTFQEKDKNPLRVEPTFQEKLKNPLRVEPTFQEKLKNPLQVEPTFQEKDKNPLRVEPTFQEKLKNPLRVEPTFQEKLKNPLQVEPTFQEKDKNPLQVEPTFQEKYKNPLQVEPTFQEKIANQPPIMMHQSAPIIHPMARMALPYPATMPQYPPYYYGAPPTRPSSFNHYGLPRFAMPPPMPSTWNGRALSENAALQTSTSASLSDVLANAMQGEYQ